MLQWANLLYYVDSVKRKTISWMKKDTNEIDTENTDPVLSRKRRMEEDLDNIHKLKRIRALPLIESRQSSDIQDYLLPNDEMRNIGGRKQTVMHYESHVKIKITSDSQPKESSPVSQVRNVARGRGIPLGDPDLPVISVDRQNLKKPSSSTVVEDPKKEKTSLPDAKISDSGLGSPEQPLPSHAASNESAKNTSTLLISERLSVQENKHFTGLVQLHTGLPVTRQSVLMKRKETEIKPSFVLPAQITKPRKQKDEPIIVDLEAEGSDISSPVGKKQSSTDEEHKNTEKRVVCKPDWSSQLMKMYSQKEQAKNKHLIKEKVMAALRRKESEEMLHQVLEERMRQHMKITDCVIEEGPLPIAADEEEEVKLPKLTQQMERTVLAAFRNGIPSDVLVEGWGIRMCRRDIVTLSAANWLNDEVINFYMNLLNERGKLENYPPVYCFSTFFYPKLASSGHASLRRWTRKIDIFSFEILIVPVHLGIHWCLACVKFTEKKILYYDSMGGSNNPCLQHLLRYLQEESIDKKKQPYDVSEWSLENVSDNPQQKNGNDCGMFACMYAEYICRKAKITFTQSDIPYFRRKMAYEILTKQLLT